jgi:hypothetical protein
MKKTKSMKLAVLAASLLCCSIFTVPAYAQSSEPQEETPPAQEAPAETAEPEPEPEAEAPDSNLLAILLVGVVVLIGGGAGY